jgi:hypothetical protein
MNATKQECGVKKDEYGRPLRSHEAGWLVSDDTPDGAERASCDEHLSWILNWNGVANTVIAIVEDAP